MAATCAKKIPYFHHNKLVRRQEREKQKKLKKLNWLKKMYAKGATQEDAAGNDFSSEEEKEEDRDPNSIEEDDDEEDAEWPSEQHNQRIQAKRAQQRKQAAITKIMSIDPSNEPQALLPSNDWESEADELLQWCNGLDYESYQSNWSNTATTRPANPHYRNTIGLANSSSLVTDKTTDAHGDISILSQTTMANLTLRDRARAISGGASAYESGMKGTVHPYVNLMRVNLNSDRSHHKHTDDVDATVEYAPPPIPPSSLLPATANIDVGYEASGRRSGSGRRSKAGKQFTMPL